MQRDAPGPSPRPPPSSTSGPHHECNPGTVRSARRDPPQRGPRGRAGGVVGWPEPAARFRGPGCYPTSAGPGRFVAVWDAMLRAPVQDGDDSLRLPPGIERSGVGWSDWFRHRDGPEGVRRCNLAAIAEMLKVSLRRNRTALDHRSTRAGSARIRRPDPCGSMRIRVDPGGSFHGDPPEGSSIHYFTRTATSPNTPSSSTSKLHVTSLNFAIVEVTVLSISLSSVGRFNPRTTSEVFCML